MGKNDYAFYQDQKGPRQGKCTNAEEKLAEYDLNFIKKVTSKEKDVPLTSSINFDSTFDMTMTEIGSDTSESEESSSASSINVLFSNQQIEQNRSSLKVAVNCERFGISDRAGAAIATATLKALGIATDTNKTNVIDRSKLRRERQKYREEIQKDEELQCGAVDGIYIDGRKDATIIGVKQGNSYHRKTIIKEHYVLVGEPYEFYITHGTGKQIAQVIYNALEKISVNDRLKVIGTDGIATMTGKKSGCIASLETKLGHPLQWIVCLLHLDELPLRHIFQQLDGSTKGPYSFSGMIGKQLNGRVSSWTADNFQPILNDQLPILPDEAIENLSSDQYYALLMCQGVMKGIADTDLKYLEVGGLCHSRWLTLGCRILRYYVSKSKPSRNCWDLFSMWFCVKLHNRITEGSKHFFYMLRLISNFSNAVVNDVGVKVLQNNAFFAHHENILLAMLGDNAQNIRAMAVDKIPQIRIQNSQQEGERLERTDQVRMFIIPKVNAGAKAYYAMSDLHLPKMHEPPATTCMSDNALQQLATNKLELNYSCRNQAVERHIQLVTEAATAVESFDQRDGMIR